MSVVSQKNASTLNSPATSGIAYLPGGLPLTFDGLIANKFSLIIPSMPEVTFFLQKFSLPDIRCVSIPLYTRDVDVNEVGDKLEFQPASIIFMVDSQLRNWSACYNRMKSMTVGGSNVGFKEDIMLMIDNKPFLTYTGAWISGLSGWEMDSTIQEVQYIKANLTLNYDYIDLVSQGNITIDSSYA